MRWQELEDEPCSVARSLAVVGDRWTLLLLRDCFLGVRRFEQFQERLGITRHLLAARLKSLVAEGILIKRAYQQAPVRHEYRLTEAGRDLYPVLMALIAWGNRHRAGSKGRPVLHVHEACGQTFDAVMVCSECRQPLDPREVRVLPGPGMPARRRAELLPGAV